MRIQRMTSALVVAVAGLTAACVGGPKVPRSPDPARTVEFYPVRKAVTFAAALEVIESVGGVVVSLDPSAGTIVYKTRSGGEAVDAYVNLLVEDSGAEGTSHVYFRPWQAVWTSGAKENVKAVAPSTSSLNEREFFDELSRRLTAGPEIARPTTSQREDGAR
jgi:hypothetical protein